jgi:hypothetical protein
LLLIPIVRQQGWFKQQKTVEVSNTETPYIPGLTVTEATLDPKTRTVKGVITNGTDKTMDDVQVSFDARMGLVQVGLLVARIPQLGPHQSARFETNPMAPNGREYVLREVTGNPR